MFESDSGSEENQLIYVNRRKPEENRLPRNEMDSGQNSNG
jgi:hypothetical protein